MSMTVLVGVVEHMGNQLLIERLNDVTEVQMPAVRYMTLIDMNHDGLQAIVYHALLVSEVDDQEGKKRVAEDLKSVSTDMARNIVEINRLRLSSEIRKEIEVVRPEIEAYLKESEAVVGLTLSGRHSEAKIRSLEFKKLFDILEKDLGSLGKSIEAEATKSRQAAIADSSTTKMVNTSIILFALIIGSLLSYLFVRDLVKSLSKVVDQLIQSSQEVLNASSQGSRSAAELSEASTEQASSIQQTMASVEEISAMVNQNAESASKVKGTVDTNKKATDEGSRSVSEMLHAIGDIKETNSEILGQMENSNREFSEIVKIISEIGEKTKVINDIVFQTKLLSFNASVEAARAGEHGKGFAVVAEEVGNLAQMSGNAAKQITDMLSGSIKKVNEIVQDTTQKVDRLVEIGKDKIAVGQSTASKCKESFERISENASTVAVMVAEIASASKEQAQGIQEINKAISQLDQVTQKNTSVAQQSSSQAEQLKSEANILSQTVKIMVRMMTAKDSEDLKDQSRIANVIPLHANMKNSLRSVSSPLAIRKASGHDSVPLSSDTEFEDF